VTAETMLTKTRCLVWLDASSWTQLYCREGIVFRAALSALPLPFLCARVTNAVAKGVGAWAVHSGGDVSYGTCLFCLRVAGRRWRA